LNVLKPHLQNTIATLLARGTRQREIDRLTGISRETIRTCQLRTLGNASNSPGVATARIKFPTPPTGFGRWQTNAVELRAIPRVHRGSGSVPP